ncbi:glycosyltransferase [Samsonia erythrinae]|nr:glycosyltransferase [Samsonia erythrinae]
MIVKNEAQHLQATLKAIAKYFDDIVIVDTGSTDDSKKIAGEFTDKIYDFTWVSDFSAARNYALQFAKYDWVLVVDADEELNFIDKDKLATQISAPPTHVGTVEIRSIISSETPEETDSVKERISRLFNRSLYHYRGIVHEQICNKKTGSLPTRRFDTSLSFLHVGYQHEILASKDKISRNINLLKEAINHAPEDPYWHYQLGKSYYLGKDYVMAAGCFENALTLQKGAYHNYNDVLIECYGYCLLNTAQYEKALDIIKYENVFTSTDFMFLKALILMNNADFQGALDTFQVCTRMEPGRKKGLNTYKANYNIAVILECFGMKPEALDYYQRCGDYRPALEGINRIR